MQAQLTLCREDRRTVRRNVVSLSAYARETDAKVWDVEVIDLSIDGCRIRGEVALEQGTDIWLKIPGIAPRSARVRWVGEREAGCEFHDPVANATLERVLPSQA